jgi:hypothetical protein
VSGKAETDDAGGAGSVGLCEHCRHVRLIRSDRGAVLYFCELSATDSRFPKYPTLPVVRCAGYKQKRRRLGGAGQE